MSDLNLIASRLPGAPGAISANAITATVPDPPRNFIALDNGTILRGTVQGRDKDGLIAISTDQGILKIATNANLPTGSNVTLEVRSVGDRLQVVVLAVEQGAQAGAAASSSSSAVQAGARSGTADSLSGAVTQGAVVDEPQPSSPVIVAGTKLTAIVIQSVPRDLLQSTIPPAPQGMGDTEPVPHGTTPVTPASGRAAFTAEFRQTPPPPVSASLIPEIHDRIAALFTEAAPVSDGAAQDPGTPPLPSVKGLTLPPEVRERIITLFIGGPSDTQVSHQSGTPQTAPAATGAAASQLSAPTAATSPALQSAAGEPVPIVPGSQPLPASPITTASSLPPPSGAPLANQPLPPTTTVTPDLPDAEPVRAGTAPTPQLIITAPAPSAVPEPNVPATPSPSTTTANVLASSSPAAGAPAATPPASQPAPAPTGIPGTPTPPVSGPQVAASLQGNLPSVPTSPTAAQPLQPGALPATQAQPAAPATSGASAASLPQPPTMPNLQPTSSQAAPTPQVSAEPVPLSSGAAPVPQQTTAPFSQPTPEQAAPVPSPTGATTAPAPQQSSPSAPLPTPQQSIAAQPIAPAASPAPLPPGTPNAPAPPQTSTQIPQPIFPQTAPAPPAALEPAPQAQPTSPPQPPLFSTSPTPAPLLPQVPAASNVPVNPAPPQASISPSQSAPAQPVQTLPTSTGPGSAGLPVSNAAVSAAAQRPTDGTVPAATASQGSVSPSTNIPVLPSGTPAPINPALLAQLTGAPIPPILTAPAGGTVTPDPTIPPSSVPATGTPIPSTSAPAPNQAIGLPNQPALTAALLAAANIGPGETSGWIGPQSPAPGPGAPSFPVPGTRSPVIAQLPQTQPNLGPSPVSPTQPLTPTALTPQDPDVPTSPISPLTSTPLLPGAMGTGDGATAGQAAGKAPAAGTTNAGAATAPATATAAENQHGTVSITAVVGAPGKMPAGNSTAAAANAEYLANNLAGAAHAAPDLGAAKLEPDFKELPSGPLPTGTELRLRVISIQQPGVPSAITTAQANLAAAGKPTIAGQILGHTPAGHPVIHTSLGDLVLQQQANLPVGAQITLALEAVEMASAAANMTAAVTPQMTALNLAQGWPTLLDLLFTLQHGPGGGASPGGDVSDPGGLAHLPQAGNKLAAGMAAAVDAFRTGDFEKLFGPLASALKATGGKQESIRKLRDEFTQLSALAQDRGNNDWRTFFLPLWDDGRLQQINLFYRRPKRGQAGDKDKDADATRFVVDVNFTRLGGCQLDGLIRKKKFDLMIRSHRELPLPVKRDIAGLFAQARELSNYAGDLSFQTTARFPVSPLDDIAKDNPTVTA